MNCPNCQTPNADGDQYCVACGNELAGVVPQTASATPAIAPPADNPVINAGPAIATLTYMGKNIPLYEGSKVTMANKASACSPTLAMESDNVSSTPVEVKVENGEIIVHDNGTSNGIRVVVYLKPGDSMPVKPGDMLMLGDQVVSIG